MVHAPATVFSNSRTQLLGALLNSLLLYHQEQLEELEETLSSLEFPSDHRTSRALVLPTYLSILMCYVLHQ